MSETKVEAGDTVHAKCGGPLMVVELVVDRADTPFARCIWFGARNILHTAAIRIVALEPAQRAPP